MNNHHRAIGSKNKDHGDHSIHGTFKKLKPDDATVAAAVIRLPRGLYSQRDFSIFWSTFSYHTHHPYSLYVDSL
jgi:homogentisate 1,2-dioxygenase